MTNRAQTHLGLKVLLMTGGVAGAFTGTHFLAMQETAQYAAQQAAQAAAVEPAAPVMAATPTQLFDPALLAPIPTVRVPQAAQPAVANPGAAGQAAMPQPAAAQPAAPAAGSSQVQAIPTAMIAVIPEFVPAPPVADSGPAPVDSGPVYEAPAPAPPVQPVAGGGSSR